MPISATTDLRTEHGEFTVRYHRVSNNIRCISFSYGDLKSDTPIVRLHSACLFGESFHSVRCDCRLQLTAAMQQIVQSGCGVIVYAFDEGRGIGLEKKIMEINIQRTQSCNTIEAMQKLGFNQHDYRTHIPESESLAELDMNKEIKLISGNPNKKKALESQGFTVVETIDLQSDFMSFEAHAERQLKVEKLGYSYKDSI